MVIVESEESEAEHDDRNYERKSEAETFPDFFEKLAAVGS